MRAWIFWPHRLTRAAIVLLTAGLVAPVGASALSISDAEVITLAVNTAVDPVTVDLDDPPAQGAWKRIRPDDPNDTVEDFVATAQGVFAKGPMIPSESNATIFDLTFQITWNGTVDGAASPEPIGEELLFAIVDSRFGPGTSFATTTNLELSGFVRGSFALNGSPITPEILADATSPTAEGFVANCSSTDQIGGCDTWLGFALPAVAGQHTLTMQFALGELPSGSGDVFFPNATFLAVPEPGAGAFLALGLAGAALRRCRRRA